MHQATEQRIDLRVTGVVQGVGFRWWTLRLARSLGLRGVVRNLPDGSVEVRAAGSPHALDEFRHSLRSGPSHATVLDLEPLPPDVRLPPEFRVES